MKNLAKIKALATDTVNRMQLQDKLGFGFGGQRDYYKVFGWDRKVTYEQALLRYQRNDIAKRIVDAHAQETWRNYPKVIGSIPEDKTLEEAWNALMQQEDLYFWSTLERADKLAGIGSFSVVFLGFDDGNNVSKEVTGTRKLLYVQPYGFGAVSIKAFESDTSKPRYGKPTLYEIKPNKDATLDKSSQVGAKSLLVHWSRIIHILENSLESNVFGTPRLLPVWNLLDDLTKVLGGSAENYWLSARGGLHVDVDKDMELHESDAKDLSDEIDEFQHQLRRVIRTRGVKIDSINHTLTDPSGVFTAIIKLIAGTTGIPIRILIGAEAGQLASMSDRSNWADRIAERQRSFADPMILLPIIQRLQSTGILPGVIADVVIEWPSTYRQTPLEEAQTAAQRARSAANLIKIADAGVDMITVQEVREVMGLKPDIPEGDIFRNAEIQEDPEDTNRNPSDRSQN